MKKCYYLALLCVLTSIVCFGQKDGLPSNYMGGVANQYENFLRKMVGFTLPEGKTSMYELESPANGVMLRWGTWAEDRFVGSWRYGEEETGFYFVYKTLSPLTGKWEEIGDGTLETNIGRNSYDVAYDYTTQTLFTIAGSKLYSNNLTDVNFTEIGTLTDGITPRSIACNKAGMLYVVAQEGGANYTPSAAKLYRVDKTTAEATLIGNLGVQISNSDQSAAFDYHTDALYIYCATGFDNSLRKFYQVDVTTGAATEVTAMAGVGIVGLSSVYYTKNVPAGRVSDLALTVNASDNNKIDLSFTVPTLDINGGSAASAAKAVIYKKSSAGAFEVIETIASVTAGSVVLKQYTVDGEGKYTYAVEILTASDISSGLVTQEVSNIMPITLPYENDFSTSKPNILVTVAAEGNVFYSPTRGVDDSPCYGFKVGSNVNRMDILEIPVQKGCTYSLTLDAQTTTTYNSSFSYMVNGTGTYFTVNAGGYNQYTVNYIATEDAAVTFSLYKSYASGADTIFIDNIVIKEAAPATAPAKTTIVSATPAPLGEMSALLRIVSPDKDMGGNPLTQLSGIKVEYTSSTYTMANYGSVILPMTSTGKDTVLTVPISTVQNSYYFIVSAYNEAGYCYDKSTTTSSIWIGEDTRPRSPSGVVAKNEADGKVSISWDAVTTGQNGGYVNAEQITYSISYSGGNIPAGIPVEVYDIKETSYLTPALPLGIYAFKVKAHYKTTVSYESSTAYIVNKTEEKQKIVTNTDKQVYAYRDYPFVCYNTSPAVTDVSGLSQTTYSVEEMGGAAYIEELHFFVLPSGSRDIKLAYSISLGYKDEAEFASNTDFVPKNELQEVFKDSIYFAPATSIVTIPIKGFYYDGTKPLVVQLVKTLSGKASTGVDIYAMSTTGYRVIASKSTTEDLSDIASSSDYPTPAYYSDGIPSLAITKNIQLSSISGSVTAEETGLPIEGAVVRIASVAGDNEKPLNVSITTDANGAYSFGVLPFNKYNVTVSAPGYVDYIGEMMVETVQTLTQDVVLEGSNKIAIKGKVVNANNDALEGVTVTLSKTEVIESTTTAADGTFNLMAYGSTEYTFTFTKANMVKLTEPHKVLALDTLFNPFTLRYETYPPTSVNAVLESNGKATISWTASTPTPVNGYRVYRGNNEQSFEQYTEVTSAPITATTFTDDALAGVEYGIFKYAVVTDWYGGDLSAPVYSAAVEKYMDITVTVNVRTDGASPEGAALTLSNTDNTYNAIAAADGKALFNNVRRGTYSLAVTLDYHKAINMTGVVVNSTTPIDSDVLEELKAMPTISSSNSIENTITIGWNISNTVNPTGYEVYLNDNKKADLKASVLTYTYTELVAGEYTVGVVAVFASGKSEMTTKVISVEGLVPPMNLNVAVNKNTAKFTWAVGGFSDPKHYEVYLNGELKADKVTSEEYTFDALDNGDYAAGVVAVYENGKSERAEKPFTISYVGIEDVFSASKVFPNPSSSGRYTLVVPASCTMSVYNVAGGMVMEKELAADNEYLLDLSEQSHGIYFLRFCNQKAASTVKVIFN